ncbi:MULTISPECIES: hypothetical protein [unclassified Rhizobium]|uniref:hypothetical protein n=1 Tax=unclassified Rhizobium TaxID=2613769 RepID=UPI00117BB09A|nr:MULTISPECIES: hypothetical protein [unclassified Rhizobium]MDH7809631.1 hypothetical protein [Rhizobium sp. AN67]MDQ4408638.1 hypothetical protein [Rhizobium sp. AN63]
MRATATRTAEILHFLCSLKLLAGADRRRTTRLVLAWRSFLGMHTRAKHSDAVARQFSMAQHKSD